MRWFATSLLLLIGCAAVQAADVPTLVPVPENEYFVEFLIPERAEKLFSAEPGSIARQMADKYYRDYIIPRFQISSRDEIRVLDVEGITQTWSSEARQRYLGKDPIRAWMPSYADPQKLSPAQKAILTSIVGLEILSNYRLPTSVHEIESLRAFEKAIETDAQLVERLLEIDAHYFSEKMSDVETWLQQNRNAPRQPPHSNKKIENLSLRELAEMIVWFRAEERVSPYWGNEVSKNSLVRMLQSKEIWGILTPTQIENLDKNSALYIEEEFARRSEAEWRSQLLNPLHDGTSLTRAPLLLGTGWALLHMTRGLRAPMAIPQPLEIFKRQMSAVSGISSDELQKWIQHPSKSLYPDEFKKAYRDQLRRPDFRESFKGARRIHQNQQALVELAAKHYGGESAAQSMGQFFEQSVLGSGLPLAESRKFVCAAELKQINSGEYRLGRAHALVQRRLVDSRRALQDRIHLKRRTREFLESEYGVNNRPWNYLPYRLRRSLWPIAKNPAAQIQSSVTGLSKSLRGRGLRLPNFRNIPAGSQFGSILPLEFSPASIGSVFARKFGWATAATGVFAALGEGLYTLEHFAAPLPSTSGADPSENKILSDILEDLESDLQIQTWSVEELRKDLKIIENKISAERRTQGLPPIAIYVDPRSSSAPSVKTDSEWSSGAGRVHSFFAVVAPVHPDQRLNWRALDEAILLRFDSVWLPASAGRPAELQSAHWELSLIYDFAKSEDERTKTKFKEMIGIEKSSVLWIDASHASVFEVIDPAGIVYKAPPKKLPE